MIKANPNSVCFSISTITVIGLFIYIFDKVCNWDSEDMVQTLCFVGSFLSIFIFKAIDLKSSGSKPRALLKIYKDLLSLSVWTMVFVTLVHELTDSRSYFDYIASVGKSMIPVACGLILYILAEFSPFQLSEQKTKDIE